MTVHLFNSTPFELTIEICKKPQKTKALLDQNPNNVRVLSIAHSDTGLDYPLLTITAKDARGNELKTVQFYTWHDYSWIISDTEIRRQKYGSNVRVADDYSDEDKEENYASQSDYKWKYRDKIKQYDWVLLTSAPLLCVGSDVMCQASLKFEVDDAATRTHGSGDSGGNTTIHIFNDSPYFLDIGVEGSDFHLYWNNPERDRVTRIQSGNKYPFITVNVLDEAGEKVKHASFYSWNDYSWIVTDECIVRQKYGASLYVAEAYTNYETDSGYSWERRNDIKRYNWTCDAMDLVVCRVDLQVPQQFPATSRMSSFSAEVAHPSGLSDMTNMEKLVADLLVEWITVMNLTRRADPGTLVRATDLIRGLWIENRRKQAMWIQSLNKASSFRLDFQRSQGDPPYDVFAIQYENRQFATVFIHRDMWNADRRMPDNRLRNAFLRSLSETTEVWISADSMGSNPPSRPQDTTGFSMVFNLALSVLIPHWAIRVWMRVDK